MALGAADLTPPQESPPADGVKPVLSDLRKRRRGQNLVGDVRDDLLVGVLGHRLELVPIVIAAEALPGRDSRGIIGR